MVAIETAAVGAGEIAGVALFLLAEKIRQSYLKPNEYDEKQTETENHEARRQPGENQEQQLSHEQEERHLQQEQRQ